MRTLDRIAILLISLAIFSLFVIGVIQPAASIYFYIAVCCTFCLVFVDHMIVITVISLFILSILLPTYAIYFYIAGGCIFFLDFESYGLWIKIRHIWLGIELKVLRKDVKRLLNKYSNQRTL